MNKLAQQSRAAKIIFSETGEVRKQLTPAQIALLWVPWEYKESVQRRYERSLTAEALVRAIETGALRAIPLKAATATDASKHDDDLSWLDGFGTNDWLLDRGEYRRSRERNPTSTRQRWSSQTVNAFEICAPDLFAWAAATNTDFPIDSDIPIWLQEAKTINDLEDVAGKQSAQQRAPISPKEDRELAEEISRIDQENGPHRWIELMEHPELEKYLQAARVVSADTLRKRMEPFGLGRRPRGRPTRKNSPI